MKGKKCKLFMKNQVAFLIAKVIPNRVPEGLARGRSFGHPQICNVGVGVGFWRQRDQRQTTKRAEREHAETLRKSTERQREDQGETWGLGSNPHPHVEKCGWIFPEVARPPKRSPERP